MFGSNSQAKEHEFLLYFLSFCLEWPLILNTHLGLTFNRPWNTHYSKMLTNSLTTYFEDLDMISPELQTKFNTVKFLEGVNHHENCKPHVILWQVTNTKPVGRLTQLAAPTCLHWTVQLKHIQSRNFAVPPHIWYDAIQELLLKHYFWLIPIFE